MLGAFNRNRDDENLMRMDGGGRSMLVNNSPLYDDYGSSSPGKNNAKRKFFLNNKNMYYKIL